MNHAELLILNGKVITVDAGFSIAEAIAVKNGRIFDVGTTAAIEQLAGEGTQIIDLGGKTILPGAHDGHMHASATGPLLDPSFLNLSYPHVTSLRELRAKLADRVEATPPGTWIYGQGWNTGTMEEFGGDPNAVITRHDLDGVSPDHPVFLSDWSCNLLVANSKALELAGVTAVCPEVPGGIIVRDPQTGELTGVFAGFPAHVLITRHAPKPTPAELRRYIKLCQQELNSKGYTSHTDAGLGVGGNDLMAGTWGSAAIDAYREMRNAGDLTCRVSVGVLPFLDTLTSYDDMMAGFDIGQSPTPEKDDSWLSWWLKIRADGVPMNYTIWMYQDQQCGHHATSNLPGETDDEQYRELLETIRYLHRQGWQVGVHAIGDRAIDKCIEAFTTVIDDFPMGDPRHYIIHAEFITEKQAEVCAKYGIGVSVQPTNDAVAFSILDGLYTWPGGPVGETVAPLRMLMEHGVNVAGGSDAPVSMPNWLQSVQAAVTRRSVLNGQIYGAENAITVEDGIRMFTINGAIQEHAEDSRGSIEPGKVADFQVLGRDILTVEKEEIGQIPVLMTIVDGKVVYEA